MNRSLGEGKIIKIVKKYAFVEDDRIGRVYFPIQAVCVINDCQDLRDHFSLDECVIFTAQRQQPPQNGCDYVATSVVKRRQLIVCSGHITAKHDKFAYANVDKYGKVFIPYSARNENNRAWLGRDCEVNRVVQLKMFRQPDIGACRYVAWQVQLTQTVHTGTGSVSGMQHEPHDSSIRRAQIGVCVMKHSESATLYSPQTGLLRLSPRPGWLEVGGWLRIDCHRQPTGTKPAWLAAKPQDLGQYYEVLPDYMSRLMMGSVDCVVNRVSTAVSGSRCAWLWNDLLGRIYVPPAMYRRELRPMDCVTVRVLYTGSYEDVPWSAVALDLCGDDQPIRDENAQLLMTDDNWEVTNVVNSDARSSYLFMNNPQFGAAFVAWTDIAEGEQLEKGTRCRATVYRQARDHKHEWRAVLVTPVEGGEPASHHPVLTGGGKRREREPIVPPHPPSPVEPPLTPSHGAIAPPHHHPAGPIGSGLLSVAVSEEHLAGGGGSSAASHQSTASLPPASPTRAFSPQGRLPSSDSSDSVSVADTLGTEFELANGGPLFNWSNPDWAPWEPRRDSASLLDGGAVVGVPLAMPSFSNLLENQPIKRTTEVATQTDTLIEQRVLKDIVSNPELLIKVFEQFPQHVDHVMNIRWQIPNE